MLPFLLWPVCLFPTCGAGGIILVGCWEQQMGDAAARAWPWPAANFESRCPLAAFVHICCGQALKKDWNCTFGVCGLVLVR